jgi:hypothetical protein
MVSEDSRALSMADNPQLFIPQASSNSVLRFGVHFSTPMEFTDPPATKDSVSTPGLCKHRPSLAEVQRCVSEGINKECTRCNIRHIKDEALAG